MMWLRTLCLLSSVLCVWQLTEGRPPAIPPRHQFNKVQSRGGSSFIQRAKMMYSQRHLQNRIIQKEKPPPRELSSTVQRRRFKTNPKPQSNLQKQSPRTSPLIARQRTIQTNAVSLNAPTLGDAIKSIMSGPLEEHINNNLKKNNPGTPSTTAAIPFVNISLDFGHPVTPESNRNQASSSTKNLDILNVNFSDKNIPKNLKRIADISGSTPQNIQEKTIILASPDYPESDIQTIDMADYSFPEQNFSSDFPEYSASLDSVANAPTSEVPAIVIPESGFPEPDFPPDFPDYSNVAATSPEVPKIEIPDSGFPEPNFPPGFPDYSDAIAPITNSQSRQGTNDFIIPDSGFPEPNFPPDFPDYSTSVDTAFGNTKSIDSSPDYNSNSPDYNAPSIDYNSNSPDYNAPSIDYNAQSQNYNSPSQDYNAPSADYNAPSQDYNGPSPDYNAPSPDYNAPSPDYNAPSPDYNAQSPDYNNPSQDYNTPSDYSSPDYPQASSQNPDYPSYDYNLDNPNKAAQAKTIRNQQDLFNLVKISLIDQLTNGGGRNSPKSISATSGRQGNPLEHILSFGQGVVGDASGAGRDLFGTGRQIVGTVQDNVAQTVDAVARAIDDISREILRSIQLIGGEIQFIANDSLQGTLQAFQRTTEIASAVGGDFYRASLQVKDLFGKFISSFIENVGRFVGTAVNRTVDGALKQAVSTGQFIGELKAELIRSILDNGNAAQKWVQGSLEDAGKFMDGMGGVTTRFTSSATRTLTGATLK